MEEFALDYSNINNVLGYNFEDWFNKPLSVNDLGEMIINGFNSETDNIKYYIISLLGCVIIASVLKNVVKNNNVGSFIIFVIFFSIISGMFFGLFDVCQNEIDKMREFMKALIPTFFMTVTYSSGSAIAFPVYETTLITLGGVQVVISDIIIPCIKGYFLLNMANYLMEKDYLLKMADLFQSVISYGLKIILFVITGINFIQNMIINNSSAIPAQLVRKAGNEISTATSVIYGAGKIIKNAVGLSGIVALIIMVVPVLVRMLMYLFLTKLMAAVFQMLSGDSRLCMALTKTGDSISLLIKTVFYITMVFSVCLSIVLIFCGYGG